MGRYAGKITHSFPTDPNKVYSPITYTITPNQAKYLITEFAKIKLRHLGIEVN